MYSTSQDKRYTVSIAEAARMIGVGRSLLYREISVGSIAAKKLGRRTLIEITEIERYLATLPTVRAS